MRGIVIKSGGGGTSKADDDAPKPAASAEGATEPCHAYAYFDR